MEILLWEKRYWSESYPDLDIVYLFCIILSLSSNESDFRGKSSVRVVQRGLHAQVRTATRASQALQGCRHSFPAPEHTANISCSRAALRCETKCREGYMPPKPGSVPKGMCVLWWSDYPSCLLLAITPPPPEGVKIFKHRTTNAWAPIYFGRGIEACDTYDAMLCVLQIIQLYRIPMQ